MVRRLGYQLYVIQQEEEEEEAVGAAQNDTAEEKLPASGSEDSDDDSSVWPYCFPHTQIYTKEAFIIIVVITKEPSNTSF